MAPRDELSAAATRVMFRDVLVLRAEPEIVLCRVGVKHVWVPRGLLPPALSAPGDSGPLTLDRGLASELGCE